MTKCRFKYIISFLSTWLLSCVMLASCGSSEDEPKQPEVIEKVNRTVLVYMVANNSLGNGDYDKTDIQEMIDAASNGGFNGGRLIVYHAPVSGNPVLKEITLSGEKVLRDYDNKLYSIDSKRMKQVIADVKSLAPADDYGLVLWSHANAWVETSTSKSILGNASYIRPAAFGEDRGYHMKVTSLADALSGADFSFVYFDCCHMASIEVVYELRNVTRFIIGSATELLAEGMPYQLNIPLFFKETPDLEGACKNTFDYYDKRPGKYRSCTISLIETAHIDELALISREIFVSGAELPENYTPQSFVRGSNCYLFDFADYMRQLVTNEGLKAKWDSALGKVVKYEASTPWFQELLRIDTHCGLGCYIVKDISESMYKGYDNQSWWKDVVSYHFK